MQSKQYSTNENIWPTISIKTQKANFPFSFRVENSTTKFVLQLHYESSTISIEMLFFSFLIEESFNS